MAKILLIEDELSLQQAYDIILSSKGHEVEKANDGAEGITKLKTFWPDLILLDVQMPKVDGIEFLKKFKKAAYGGVMPKIIVFSNMDHAALLDKAYKLGATRYILKATTTPKDLIKLVADTLKN